MSKLSEKPSYSIFGIFQRYASDNKEVLSVIGVVATVTALFLNLDATIYSNGLQGLQIVLLLFLVLSLVFLAVTSHIWFVKNADSWFAGLIVSTQALFIWRLLIFIKENFRDELNQYLKFTILLAMIIVGTFLSRMRSKIEERFPKYTYRSTNILWPNSFRVYLCI